MQKNSTRNLKKFLRNLVENCYILQKQINNKIISKNVRT